MVEYEARGITVRDVAPAVFIEAYALHLKNSDRFEIPKWPHRQARGHPRCASHACSLQVLHVLALFLPHLLQP